MKTLLIAYIASSFLCSCGSNSNRDRNEVKQDTVRNPGTGNSSIRDTASYERMPQKTNDSTTK